MRHYAKWANFKQMNDKLNSYELIFIIQHEKICHAKAFLTRKAYLEFLRIFIYSLKFR